MLLQQPLRDWKTVPGTTVGATTLTTITCPLNLGDRVHVLWIEVGDNAGTTMGTLAAPTFLSTCRLIVDDKVQREFTIQELNELNRINGAQYGIKTSGTAGNGAYRSRIPIYLAERWRKGYVLDKKTGLTVPESYLTAWNLQGIESAKIELDIVAGITAPTITGFYEYDEAVAELGDIVKWKRQTVGVTASPAEIRDELSRISGQFQSLHLFPTSDNKYVTSLEMTRNNSNIRKAITRFQNDAMLLGADMFPTALDTTSNATIQNTGLFNLVFDYDDPMYNALAVQGVKELTIKPTYNAAPTGQFNMITQINGPKD
jgi:hypothetical protein